MKKYTLYTFFVCLVLAISMNSCQDDYLDRQDDGKLQEEKVFIKFNEFSKLITQLYTDMYDRSRGLEMLYSHNLGTICDELEFNKADSDAPFKILNGELSADPSSISNIGGSSMGWWWKQYQTIRKANKAIWGAEKYNTPDHPSRPGLLDRRIGEAYFFRVYYHYMLLRWHGEICYMDRVIDVKEDPKTYAIRESVHTSIEKMCRDLDIASSKLPVKQSGEEFNRIDKGACLALKSILRWIAAQPLYNGGENGLSPLRGNDIRVGADEYKIYDKHRWELARDAAKELLDLTGSNGKRYELYTKYTDKDFVDEVDELSNSNNTVYRRLSEMFQDEDFYTKEVILTLKGGKDTRWIGDNIPDRTDAGMHGQTRNMPTQEQVDQYEYITGNEGYSIFDQGAKNGGYDDENPYINRDPRMYRDIVFAGSKFQNIQYETQEGGHDEIVNSSDRGTKKTRTGYALRKFIIENWTKESSTTAMFFPLIRLPEIMLIYCEALNECDDASASIEIPRLLNLIRERSFMKPVPASIAGDKAKQSAYIERERRVEFFYENNRYFRIRYQGLPTSSVEKMKENEYLSMSSEPDVRAAEWVKQGNGQYPQTQHYIHGMKPVEDANGKVEIGGKKYKMVRFEGKQMVRKFSFRSYFFPINSNEIAKTPSLIQNPGW